MNFAASLHFPNGHIGLELSFKNELKICMADVQQTYISPIKFKCIQMGAKSKRIALKHICIISNFIILCNPCTLLISKWKYVLTEQDLDKHSSVVL